MDPSLYKDLATSRGVNYHYYSLPPSNGKPTLLLIHGFPSSSYDWRHQIEFFSNAGYGLVVPDMLGYGGTSKPSEPEAYVPSLVCKDLVEILDAEKVQQAIAIGHDWGSVFCGRLAGHFPDRFLAYAFLAIGYRPPTPHVKLEDFLAFTTKIAGYPLFGYWAFFAEADAPQLIQDNMDSFMSLIFSKDIQIQRDNFGPVGATRSWLIEGRIAELSDWISKEELKYKTETLRNGGLVGPLCYYKIVVSGIDAEDNGAIPKENYKIKAPTFFGGASRDPIGLVPMQLQAMTPTCEDLTIKNYDAGHWVMIEAKDAVNQDLLEWIRKL